MALHDAVATRATTLLRMIASGNTGAVNEYESLLFPVLRDTALRRGHAMAGEAAAKLGLELGSAVVRSADREEVAVLAAQIALQRARASALRFDPARGDGASWALGALGHAYRDAARRVSGSRRTAAEEPADDETLTAHLQMDAVDPYLQVEARDALQRALSTLDADEQYAILAHLHYGLSYREIALYRFGNEGLTKKVDRVMQAARTKLRVAHEAWADGT